jgi:hypothetical protein
MAREKVGRMGLVTDAGVDDGTWERVWDGAEDGFWDSAAKLDVISLEEEEGRASALKMPS